MSRRGLRDFAAVENSPAGLSLSRHYAFSPSPRRKLLMARRLFRDREESVSHLTRSQERISVPHSLSAKKRVRQNEKHRARNRARKDDIKLATKSFLTSLGSNDMAKAGDALNLVVRRLDKVAAKGTIHKNTAARRR